MSERNRMQIHRLVSAALCLALCLVLPFLTGQIPEIGSALCPMHIPVLLGGFLCGPWWAGAVGFAAPLLRFALFGMPPMPAGMAMCFELAAYGLVSGLLYGRLPGTARSVYLSLLAAMAVGRGIWGLARLALTGVTGTPFTWALFLSGAFTSAIPGIVVHIILIPVLVLALKRAGLLPAK